MSDTGRESITDKVAREAKPDSQKTLFEQGKDKATGAYESVASSAQPAGEKSYLQQATDLVSGDGGNKSLLDQAKDALGVNNSTTTTNTNTHSTAGSDRPIN